MANILDFFQLIEEFCQLKDLSAEQLGKAENAWNSILNKCAKKLRRLDSRKEFEVMSAMLYYLVGEDETRVSNILVYAEKVDNEISEKQNHPYLVLFGTDFDVVKATLVIEQHDVLAFKKPNTFPCFLALIATFYIFELQYPVGCKAAYTALVNTVIFDKPCKYRKLNAILHV